MSGHAAALSAAARATAAIECLTDGRVLLDPAAVLDRSDVVPLQPASAVSPNGSCRLIAAADGWIGVNLPREDDADLVPAWTGCAFGDAIWPAIVAAASQEPAERFVARGAELGLATARLGETSRAGAMLFHPAGAAPGRVTGRLRVLDLSALWAGPLCAGVLARAGHDVLKVEAVGRPDPVARSAPAHDARLNGMKRRKAIDFRRDTLLPLLIEADVVVTSARPRAFAAMDLTPEHLFAMKPQLIWVAITGHGWHGAGASRIAFGDDAAVAGGLVDWQEGRPVFAGDALADPLTGLSAAVAALKAIEDGGGVIVDAALAAAAADAVRQAGE